MSWRSDLRKLSQSSAAEWLLLGEALFWLAAMRVGVSLVPFRWLMRVLGLTVAPGDAATAGNPADVRGVARAIVIVADRTPWPSTCLVRALAAAVLLRRRASSSLLTLGVARDQSGKERIAAHAWLRCGDTVVTGGTEAARFTPLSSFLCPPRRLSRAPE